MFYLKLVTFLIFLTSKISLCQTKFTGSYVWKETWANDHIPWHRLEIHADSSFTYQLKTDVPISSGAGIWRIQADSILLVFKDAHSSVVRRSNTPSQNKKTIQVENIFPPLEYDESIEIITASYPNNRYLKVDSKKTSAILLASESFVQIERQGFDLIKVDSIRSSERWDLQFTKIPYGIVLQTGEWKVKIGTNASSGQDYLGNFLKID